MSTDPAIKVENLWQVFGDNSAPVFKSAQARNSSVEELANQLKGNGLIPAVRNVSFEVQQGELFVIMGLSGSGKSTLIRGISRLVEPTSGRVLLEGEDILAANKARMTELRRSKLGMVFQHFGLFPHMKVIDNIAYPLKVGRMGRKERHEKAAKVIDMVGLAGREDAYPRELSGGQRQRVGIARSLVTDCSVWFLDEPFSALDPLIRRQLQDEFLDIRERLNTTIVFITHDIAEALKLADRIAIMRDGEVVQIGTPDEIVLRPVDGYVREFTRDVAKARHAKISSVMQESSGKGSGKAGLHMNMTLEEALAAHVELSEPIEVADADGVIVGVVKPQDLAAAIRAEPA